MVNTNIYDTILVAANQDSLNNIFIAKNLWYGPRIAEYRWSDFKYIATYVKSPISGITHYARVEKIEKSKILRHNCEIIITKGSIVKLERPIRIENPSQSVQSLKYTNFDKLIKAKTMADI